MITVHVDLNVPWLPRERRFMALRDGCTVGEMLENLGIVGDRRDHLLAVVNGRSALAEDRLRDGDGIVVLPVLCGG